jgi:hypothetical protein
MNNFLMSDFSTLPRSTAVARTAIDQRASWMHRSYMSAVGILSVLSAGCLIVMIMMLSSGAAHAERVKDLASVSGVRGNQLVGYGLVVGLDGTGDQTSQAPFTIQSIRNMLAKFGVTIPANVNPQLKMSQR